MLNDETVIKQSIITAKQCNLLMSRTTSYSPPPSASLYIKKLLYKPYSEKGFEINVAVATESLYNKLGKDEGFFEQG